MSYKLVVAVREDLGLSSGKTAVQVAHAAVGCVMKARATNAKWYSRWDHEGGKKVVVHVEREEDLRSLERIADKEGLPLYLVSDAGLTEVPPGTITCIGLGPAPDHLLNPLTGSLPLL